MRVRVVFREPGRKHQYADVYVQLPKRLEGYEVSSSEGGAIVADVKDGEIHVTLRRKRVRKR